MLSEFWETVKVRVGFLHGQLPKKILSAAFEGCIIQRTAYRHTRHLGLIKSGDGILRFAQNDELGVFRLIATSSTKDPRKEASCMKVKWLN